MPPIGRLSKWTWTVRSNRGRVTVLATMNSRNTWKRRSVALGFWLLCHAGVFLAESFGQGTGELAEMDRLVRQTNELAAEADPEGAAQAIGKAAMMADILTKQSSEPFTQSVFQAASRQYRAQERGLRALALYERGGGMPPAPAGICHALTQAVDQLRESKETLTRSPAPAQAEMAARQLALLTHNQEWEHLMKGLHEVVECTEK